MPQFISAKALREKRAEVAKKTTALAESLQADNEARQAKGEPPREWTEQEAKDWAALDAEYKHLTAQIAIADRVEAVQGDQRRPAGDPDVGRDPTLSRGLSRDSLHDFSALAIQAWFRCNTSDRSRFPFTDQHERACEALGFNPRADELAIKLLPTDQYANLQEAYRSSTPAEAKRRSLQMLGALNYSAAANLAGHGPAADGATIMAPESMMNSLEINMLAYGGVMNACEVMRTSGRERMRWPTVNDTSNKGRRLGEAQPVAPTKPVFGATYWDAWKYTSDEILVPFELLNGTPYNLAVVLGQMMGERIGRKANDDLTVGIGSNQPWGLVPRSTPFAAAVAGAVSWDDLDNLIAAVDPAYRVGAAFMFHDAIRNAIRKTKDGQGRPLWLAEANGSEPALLKGYPWFINQSMDDTIVSGKKTVLFGQFKKYKVRQVDEVRIYRLVERHRENDMDAFLAFSELDGNLLDAGTAPVKCLTQP